MIDDEEVNCTLQNLYPKVKDLAHKDSAMSDKVRKEGNQLYTSGDHNLEIHCRILSLYTQSAALAENDSEELALAYSNRSALLLHLHKYKECLVDVERSLQISKSDKLKSKLTARKDKCLSMISLEKSEPIKEIPSEMQIKPSKCIPCASEFVDLKFDEKYGRHIVANQDIEPGTLIAIEEGFKFLKIHKIYLHCTHCLNFAWNGIPCESCSITIYCSKKCNNEARLQYHDDECFILPYLHCITNDKEYRINIMMCIRIFIQFVKKEGLGNIIKQANHIDTNKVETLSKFFNKGVFQSNSFKTIYNLSKTQTDAKEFSRLRVFNIVLVELFMAKTKIFDNFQLNGNVKESIYRILASLKEIVDKNVYSYNHIKDNGLFCTENNQYSIYNIGAILTSFCSLFNHSCDDNVFRTFYNGQLIICTLNHIKKGQQLFVTYGPDISIRVAMRKMYLKNNYNFYCDCVPCTKNWSIQIYEEQECHEKELRNLMLELKRTGKVKIYSIVSDPSLMYPLTAQLLNDVRKVIKIVYKKCSYFNAIVLTILLKTYIIKYFTDFYGIKINIYDHC